MTDALDVAEIGRLAKAAGGSSPSGRWAARMFIAEPDWFVQSEHPHIVCGDDCEPSPQEAAHIASMDPATTLRLLNMLALKEFEIGDLDAKLFVERSKRVSADAEIERLKAELSAANATILRRIST